MSGECVPGETCTPFHSPKNQSPALGRIEIPQPHEKGLRWQISLHHKRCTNDRIPPPVASPSRNRILRIGPAKVEKGGQEYEKQSCGIVEVNPYYQKCTSETFLGVRKGLREHCNT
jgi:hypothetical protein